MPRFDPERLLALIDRERVTHLHVVPIMFERLLKLPEEVRSATTSRRCGSWCTRRRRAPPTTKRAMIEWWGPVIHEYYGIDGDRAGDVPHGRRSGSSIRVRWGKPMEGAERARDR